MLYIPKIYNYLKILTDEKVKDFEAIHFSEYFKSIREEQNLRKVAKLSYVFPTTHHEVENISNQILLIIVYITIMLRCSTFLIQNYN